jgi:hypothetical protein
MQATTQYFEKTVFYKQVLDLYRPSKFYARIWILDVKITVLYCARY